MHSQQKSIISLIIKEEEGGWVLTNYSTDPDVWTYAGIRKMLFEANNVPKGYIDRITKHVIPDQKVLLPVDLVKIMEPYVYGIYYTEFVSKLTLLEIDFADLPAIMRLNFNVFYSRLLSCMINCGARTGIRIFQTAINARIIAATYDSQIRVDGFFGLHSNAALNRLLKCESPGLGYLTQEFYKAWVLHYADIVQHNPAQIVNFRGWINRVYR